ncbi:carbohydrate-binding domain-containing protein [Actinoplanes sp. NPDC026619]|uniref:carbohydrate-binding domain-containing protein n=1 Tax=Actinoplanes sp. NPDC026619 TaxID=3155798 RepID=UPI0033E8DBAF
MAPAPAFADVSGELDGGKIAPAANAQKSAETAASGGYAIEMWDTSSVELKVTNLTATVAYKIRARQEICGAAAAQMTVKIDGAAAGTYTVANTTYQDFSVAGNWAAGEHLVHVDFVNPYFQADCIARELWLDKVTAVSPGRTYYVDRTAAAGGTGLSSTSAWNSLDTVKDAALTPGDTVLFKAGQTWTNANLIISRPGTAAATITFGSYGTGAAPIFDGGGNHHPIDISADARFVTVQDVQVRNAGDSDQVGLAVSGKDVLVQRVTATGNAIGVQAYDDADRLRVTASVLSNNRTVINPDGLGADEESSDDYGANGAVVLAAAGVRIDHNTINGNYGPSADFDYDGSAVEVYGAVDLTVDHNTATDNQTFSELGDSRTSNAWFFDNVITTSASFSAGQVIGINLQGGGEFGVVHGTKVTNNTFVLRNPEAGALVVGAGADARFQNNIVQADSAGYTNGQRIDEGHNVYYNWTYIDGMLSSDNTSADGGIAPSSTTANPLFVSGTDFHLQTGSPAKNRGADAYTVTTDRDDLPRVFGASVDAGAYERQTA